MEVNPGVRIILGSVRTEAGSSRKGQSPHNQARVHKSLSRRVCRDRSPRDRGPRSGVVLWIGSRNRQRVRSLAIRCGGHDAARLGCPPQRIIPPPERARACRRGAPRNRMNARGRSIAPGVARANPRNRRSPSDRTPETPVGRGPVIADRRDHAIPRLAARRR